MSVDLLPERIILDLLQLGVAAITADTALLDPILSTLSAAELAEAKTYWTAHPPEVKQGYARLDWVFPAYAVTLSADDPLQDYIGNYEEELLSDPDEDLEGDISGQRITGRFTVYIYAEHPDICAWYYRVLRRICNVGITYLIANGLDDPKLQGADLAPDPRYTPDNLFVRRLTISVEYQEQWTNQDALWLAVNGTPEEFITDPDSISVHHKDIVVDGRRGGVVPETDL